MKKHYILAIVSRSEEDTHLADQAWHLFVEKTRSIKSTDKGIRRLHDSCWLLDRNSAASTLAKIVAAAEAQQLKYEVLYLVSDE